MPNAPCATPGPASDPITVQIQSLAAEIRALALRMETLHGKLDAALDIHELLGALEARLRERS